MILQRLHRRSQLQRINAGGVLLAFLVFTLVGIKPAYKAR